MKVIKKDGSKMDFNEKKIVDAIVKSAERVMVSLSEKDISKVLKKVSTLCENINEIEVASLHNIVETSLDKVNKDAAKSYREYRNYKKDFVGMLDDVYSKAQKIMYLGDKENSNTDSALVSTKRSLIYNELNKELYNKFFLNTEEKQACRDGYIYIHDKAQRRDTLNCCLADVKSVMTGGFEMGNMWYNEPNSIDTACDVLGDIIMMSASQNYGGYSVRIDDLLAPYVEKSYNRHRNDTLKILGEFDNICISDEKLDKISIEKTMRELEQGMQGLEYKLNSVASSRGDYIFVTFAFGMDNSRFGKMVSEATLRTRMNGQGEEGKKRQVLFPKLVFTYHEDCHGENKDHEDLFNLAIECSSASMYPDFLSLSGDSYVGEMYQKYGEIVYPMG